MRRWRATAIAAGLLLAGWQWGQAGWIAGKAVTAQWLLERAWEERLAGGEARPWPWADFMPVARLVVPELDVERIVLGDASPRTLAFGPGHVPASAPPGAPGTVVLAGHRDTHFAFLRHVRAGMTLEMRPAEGPARSYRVVATRVMDTRLERVVLDHPGRLVLSTCWPFDALVPGGPLRYLVIAERSNPRRPTPGADSPGLTQI